MYKIKVDALQCLVLALNNIDGTNFISIIKLAQSYTSNEKVKKVIPILWVGIKKLFPEYK
ncbi:MAG: hypothetical protein ACTSXT_13570 [Candidatus Helarchaeota archaeon]